MTAEEAVAYCPLAWLGQELAAAARVDAMAVEAQALAYLGLYLGQEVRVEFNSMEFPLAISVVVVGDTNSGKGTSVTHVERAFQPLIDKDLFWSTGGAIASGPALVHRLAKLPGIHLSWKTPEFVKLLATTKARDSVLSATLREALDHGRLDNDALTSGSVVARKGSYTIGLIGHITSGELSARINGIDLSNGLANRLAWFSISTPPRKRYSSRVDASVFSRFMAMLMGGKALTWTRPDEPIVFTPTPDAEDYLEDVLGAIYDEPDPDALPSLAASATARSMPFLVRIASLCAMSRGEFAQWNLDDIRYAERVWAYAFRSANELFGGFSGSPQVDALVSDLAALYGDPRQSAWYPDTQKNLQPYGGPVTKNEAIRLGLIKQHKVYRVDEDGNHVAGRPRLLLMLSDASARRLELPLRQPPPDEVI